MTWGSGQGQCWTGEYSTVQYSTVQYSTVQPVCRLYRWAQATDLGVKIAALLAQVGTGVCTVLYSTVPYCTVLYCTVLYCTHLSPLLSPRTRPRPCRAPSCASSGCSASSLSSWLNINRSCLHWSEEEREDVTINDDLENNNNIVSHCHRQWYRILMKADPKT